MKDKKGFPFKDMTLTGWQNLALAGTITFYVIFIGFILFDFNICTNFAVDYCAYWSVGKIINLSSFADIYNLDLLAKFQGEILPISKLSSEVIKPIEVPYLPVFVLPFQLLSLMNLELSYLVWTLINLIGFVAYLRFFSKKATGKTLPFRLILMMMLSLPVFINLLEGQVNIWLGICIGEFMRALFSNKPWRAGLWLGGWLLKPQIIVLIIPFLLIQKSIKVLMGFAVSSFGVLISSLALVKMDGLINLFKIIFISAEGEATSNPYAMMNWRMIGSHLSFLTSQTFGWMVIIIGTLLTVILVFYFFGRKRIIGSPQFDIALLGICAATGLIAWHAHLHMSIILIPPMLYLLINNRFDEKLFFAWVFLPILVELIGYVIGSLIQLENPGMSITLILRLARGLPGFVLNLLILFWAIIKFNKLEKVSGAGLRVNN